MKYGPTDQIQIFEKIDSFGKMWRNNNSESKHSDGLVVEFTKKKMI